MKVLFVCYTHQKKHFLYQHSELLKRLGVSVNWFIIDDGSHDTLNSRRGLKDLPLLVKGLHSKIQRLKPKLIISITPKGGLVAAISSKISRVEHLHWFTGQVWTNYKIPFKILFSFPDRIINILANYQFVDSHPQKEYLVKSFFREKNLKVIGQGSINGAPSFLAKVPLRAPSHKIKLGIVGRVCRDKGFDQLIKMITNDYFDTNKFQILIFGDFDEHDSELKNDLMKIVRNPRYDVNWLGNVDEKNTIYNSIDVLLSMSRREGFSNVMAEAQYASKPVLGRNIYATQTTIIQGMTGEFFDGEFDLLNKLEIIQRNYLRYASNARIHAKTNFDQNIVVRNICNEYLEILK